MTRDVVVVGAGPAGSVAAAALAGRGRDVLLLDRDGFPRDKPCGDGIPPGTVGVLDGLGMSAALRGAGFHSIRGLRLVSPRGRGWRVEIRPRREGAEFFIAPRLVLDDLIRRHAVDCGAEFRRATVRSLVVESGRVAGVRAVVDGTERPIAARCVIGADGATSIVARSLAGNKARAGHRAVAIRAYVEGIATLPHTIELHWYARFAPGYGWIFPTGPASANVGVVVRADHFKRRGVSLEDLLGEFLHAPDVSARLDARATVAGKAAWQLPYATPRGIQRAFDGALLVGDAGRLVDSLTGEGIHHAVASAMMAADVVDRALSRKDTSLAALAEFDARCERELGPYIRRSYRFQRYLAPHPWMVEGVFLAMRVAYRPVTRWLDRLSTEFEVGAFPAGECRGAE